MNDFNPQEYWETTLQKNFNVVGVGHSGLGVQYNKWMYRVRKYVFIRQLRHLSGLTSADILDIGSGTGFYIERWKQIGIKSVTGSDITSVSVNELKKRFPDSKFYQIDIGDAVTHSKKYDMISAFDVLFHIVDDNRFEKALQNIHSLLKPGGYFVFSDNFLHGLPERATTQVSRSLKDITETLEKTGFHIIKRVPMFVLMSNPVDSQSWLLKSLWRVIKYCIARSEVVGFVVGTVLYPAEVVLVSLLEESPTTEMAICKRE
ncbi:MAG: class I SAM-dependent methyltransferase [Theionarchaea archaeon]|nr:MAG: hypothetical protein AYK19_00345 [Theionarchaea archaeon DG-70-1]MBU7025621.1 class I SAM-dependent methyltransferase [Theionarchaea archaeon]